MSTDIERAVAGAALLDRNVPDWYVKIDCASLDILSPVKCVLGQVFSGADESGYVVGLRELGLSGGESIKYGFAARTSELEEAWREQIAKRRLRVPVAA